MKIWVDDVRPAPEGYTWCKSVNEFKRIIEYKVAFYQSAKSIADSEHIRYSIPKDLGIEIIDIDHDAGDYVNDGGDYIRILDYLEAKHYDDFTIKIHSMNPVGRQNMERIIHKNNWKYIV